MVNLGKIEKIALREVWPNEAQDFTPWLAEHLSILGESLGLDLELESSEAPVGPFALDVLATDLGSRRRVVIENQLEFTDHDHLGKLLTYASGYEAGVVDWLAREFRDEHRAALDWLNQHTDENTDFFGVVVEAWKIDDSRAAPYFNIVTAPNDWSKQTSNSNRDPANANVSERRERYRNYFQELIDVLREDVKFTNARKGQPTSWYTFSSGFGGISYIAAFNQGGRARVGVYIDRDDPIWNKQLFEALNERRDAIEMSLGEGLEWDEMPGSRACSIYELRWGSIDFPPQELEMLSSWMLRRLPALKTSFGPHLQDLVK